MQPDEILDIFPNHLAIDYRQVNQPSKVNRKKNNFVNQNNKQNSKQQRFLEPKSIKCNKKWYFKNV